MISIRALRRAHDMYTSKLFMSHHSKRNTCLFILLIDDTHCIVIVITIILLK